MAPAASESPDIVDTIADTVTLKLARYVTMFISCIPIGFIWILVAAWQNPPPALFTLIPVGLIAYACYAFYVIYRLPKLLVLEERPLGSALREVTFYAFFKRGISRLMKKSARPANPFVTRQE